MGVFGFWKASLILDSDGKSVDGMWQFGRVVVPDYMTAALEKNKKALAIFDRFSPSHKREYVEWITEAKGEDTRHRRLAQAIEWMAEGKPRNWKYMRS